MDTDESILYHFYRRENNYKYCYYNTVSETYGEATFVVTEIYTHSSSASLETIRKRYSPSKVITLNGKYYFILRNDNDSFIELDTAKEKEHLFILLNGFKFYSNKKEFVSVPLNIFVYTIYGNDIYFIVIKKVGISDIMRFPMDSFVYKDFFVNNKINLVIHDTRKYPFDDMKNVMHMSINSIIKCFFPQFSDTSLQYVSRILFGTYMNTNNIGDKLKLYYDIFKEIEIDLKKSAFHGNTTLQNVVRKFPIHKPLVRDLYNDFRMPFGYYRNIYAYGLAILLDGDIEKEKSRNSVWLKALCETQQINVPNNIIGISKGVCYLNSQHSSNDFFYTFYSHHFYLSDGTQIFITKENIISIILGENESDFEYNQFNNIYSLLVFNTINNSVFSLESIMDNMFINNPSDFFIGDIGWKVNDTYTKNIEDVELKSYVNDFQNRLGLIRECMNV